MAEANAEMSPVLLTFATARRSSNCDLSDTLRRSDGNRVVADVPLVVPWALAIADAHNRYRIGDRRNRRAASNRELTNTLHRSNRDRGARRPEPWHGVDVNHAVVVDDCRGRRRRNRDLTNTLAAAIATANAGSGALAKALAVTLMLEPELCTKALAVRWSQSRADQYPEPRQSPPQPVRP